MYQKYSSIFSLDSVVLDTLPSLFKCNQDSFIEKVVMFKRELRDLRGNQRILFHRLQYRKSLRQKQQVERFVHQVIREFGSFKGMASKFEIVMRSFNLEIS